MSPQKQRQYLELFVMFLKPFLNNLCSVAGNVMAMEGCIWSAIFFRLVVHFKTDYQTHKTSKCPRRSPVSVSMVISSSVKLLHWTLCSTQVALLIICTTGLLSTDSFRSWPELCFSAICATVALLCDWNRQTILCSTCISETWALMTLTQVSFLAPRKKVLSTFGKY